MDHIIRLEGTELRAFLAYVGEAWRADSTQEPLRTLRIAIDEGAVKLKFNEHTWTRPLGEMEDRPHCHRSGCTKRVAE